MTINIGEFHHEKVGTYRIEISNDKEFELRRRALNKEFRRKGVKKPDDYWKIRKI